MTPCKICGIPLGYYETCPSPKCPCFNTRAGSEEMEQAARSWLAWIDLPHSERVAERIRTERRSMTVARGYFVSPTERTLDGNEALEIVFEHRSMDDYDDDK